MLQASLQLYRNAYSGLSRQMWWLSFVIFINRSGTMVIPFLTVYLTHKGYTLEQAGFVMGAFGTGAILGGYLGGRLTDRFGHFYVQVFSLILNGLLFIVLGQMRSLTQITICIFILSSLGEAFRPANSTAIANYSNESNRTRCYSLNRLAINLGWSVGPAIGGMLASISYSLLFWADGLTCILASLVLYGVFRSNKNLQPKKKKSVERDKGPSAYRDKIFLSGMLCIYLVGVCFFQMFSILPVYFKEQVHLNEATIGWILAMNGLIIALVEMVLV
ncbi:MAG: MFS transporter, partial [Flavisolibacter sp.]